MSNRFFDAVEIEEERIAAGPGKAKPESVGLDDVRLPLPNETSTSVKIRSHGPGDRVAGREVHIDRVRHHRPARRNTDLNAMSLRRSPSLSMASRWIASAARRRSFGVEDQHGACRICGRRNAYRSHTDRDADPQRWPRLRPVKWFDMGPIQPRVTVPPSRRSRDCPTQCPARTFAGWHCSSPSRRRYSQTRVLNDR